MRKPGGYLICTSDDGVTENDTFTCCHCGKIVTVKPMMPPEQMGGRCGVCDRLTCAQCAALGRCDPLEEKLKRAEASYHARRSYGLEA